MIDPSEYVQKLLTQKVENSSKYDSAVFKEFSEITEINESASEIIKLQGLIMEKWRINSRIIDFEGLRIVLPNATQHKPYKFSFEPNFFEKNRIFHYYFIGLEDLGLDYDHESLTISGNPTQSGNLKIDLKFLVEGESETKEHHLKMLNLVINPDPKTLWKNIPSDKEAIFWKKDNKSSSAKLKDKYIIASSRRGRSHQNVGSFRDDDYAFEYFEDTGWTVVAVSDGAGSYPFSRKGSEVACSEVVNYLRDHISSEEWHAFEQKLIAFKKADANEDLNANDIEKASESISKTKELESSEVSEKWDSIITEGEHDDIDLSEVLEGTVSVGNSDASEVLEEANDKENPDTSEVLEETISTENPASAETSDIANDSSDQAVDNSNVVDSEQDSGDSNAEGNKDESADDILKSIKKDYIQALYQAVRHAHGKIEDLAKRTFDVKPELKNHPKAKANVDYFHSTLIFTVFKKFDFGYVILTFSVGDCPIGIMDVDESDATLLNWLDVGEFGGGTRFVTQREIYQSTDRPIQDRFRIEIKEDFSYLFLMTDGIYDAKFEVEANLDKTEKWKEFIADLKGNNEDGVAIDFGEDIEKAEGQLNEWMDFWSKGNHDDRTLAIIYKA